jgi:hypothetical protein
MGHRDKPGGDDLRGGESAFVVAGISWSKPDPLMLGSDRSLVFIV